MLMHSLDLRRPVALRIWSGLVLIILVMRDGKRTRQECMVAGVHCDDVRISLGIFRAREGTACDRTWAWDQLSSRKYMPGLSLTGPSFNTLVAQSSRP